MKVGLHVTPVTVAATYPVTLGPPYSQQQVEPKRESINVYSINYMAASV
jgi:hypothetical protein